MNTHVSAATRGLFCLLLVCGMVAVRGQEKKLLFEETFEKGMANWVAEVQSGKVSANNGRMEINIGGGATIIFKEKLPNNILIEYEVTMVMKGGKNDRLSDCNLFWMMTKAKGGGIPTGGGGKFQNYWPNPGYYAGIGGNNNSTTRFRRHPRKSVREPALQSHGYRLKKNTMFKISITCREGRTMLHIDGRKIFDYNDSRPYITGWFAIRSLRNHVLIDNFRVYSLDGGGPDPEPEPDTIPELKLRDDGSYTIQAGRMKLSGYETDANDTTLIRIAEGSDSGIASVIFPGDTGTYDIAIAYRDESDGVSAWKLTAGGSQVGTWEGTYLDAASTGMQAKTKEFSSIKLNTGDTITLEATVNEGERGRLDSMEVRPSSTWIMPTLVPPRSAVPVKRIFYVPENGLHRFRIRGKGSYLFTLTDARGTVMHSGAATGTALITIPRASIPPGLYLARATGDRTQSSRLIVLSR